MYIYIYCTGGHLYTSSYYIGNICLPLLDNIVCIEHLYQINYCMMVLYMCIIFKHVLICSECIVA